MKHRSVRLVSVAALVLGAFAGTAQAQNAAPPAAPPAAEGAPATEPPPSGPDGAPPAAVAAVAAVGGENYNTRPITLRTGGLKIEGDFVFNMSSDAVGKPIFITPNVYYGVNDQLTIGIAHNPLSEVFPFFGGGLCLTGDSGNCAKFYNNLSLDALYSFMRSAGLEVAGHGGLDFRSLTDPFLVALRLGAQIKFSSGPLGIVADPAVIIGLNDRDINNDLLFIPIRVGFQATNEFNVGLITGLWGAFDGFGDTYQIPLGAGAVFALNPMLDLRATFTFTNLAGQGSSADGRVLTVGAAYRM
jgi:hypothetical protein